MGDLRLSGSIIRNSRFIFMKERMFESFKWANFQGKHSDAGADQGFLERGFMCIKDVGFISFILNIPWKWNNLVSLRPNYFIFRGYLIAENPLNPLLPRKFAHLNDLSIHSFDCMVLRSFHTSSRYDFHSNVIRPARLMFLQCSNRTGLPIFMLQFLIGCRPFYVSL